MDLWESESAWDLHSCADTRHGREMKEKQGKWKRGNARERIRLLCYSDLPGV